MLLKALDVIKSDSRRWNFEISVKEFGLNHDVAVEDSRGHHLRLGRRLDQALPRVIWVGNNETELEMPLF